jgi:branched-chain amino acid transport system substrate-binding protein
VQRTRTYPFPQSEFGATLLPLNKKGMEEALKTNRRGFMGGVSSAAILTASTRAYAQKKYDDGASDTEIKIGHCCPYSGPASAYGVIGQGHQAFFKALNEAGGINGRKVNFVTLDDGYSPPKAVECVRQLVEQDKVLLLFQTLGTPTNTAIHKYVNQKKVPHLFISTGASKWGDPEHFPWTMGFQPDYNTEGQIYAKHMLANTKDPKISIMMQNDDFGKDYVDGFKKGLGAANAGKIVKHVTYEVTDPTVDSQVIQLKDSGANVFFNVSTPKFAAQAIRKAADIGWKPTQYLVNVSASVGSVIKPAGYPAAQGIFTAAYLKDPTDKQWDNAEDMKAWRVWMAKNMPSASTLDANYVFAHSVASLMVETLKRCGDDLTRANVMKQAASFKGYVAPLLLPGISINTSATDYYPIQAVQLAVFKAESWDLFGEVMHAESS